MEDQRNQHFFLNPGHIYHTTEPVTIHTVVGNCVTVCMWDQGRGVGAMNHFLYPFTKDPAKSTPRYGNAATAKLTALMLESGSKRHNLTAQIFGGAAHRQHGDPGLGEKNVAAAHAVLRAKGIPVFSEDTGGAMGRKIAFDAATGHVIVLKVHDLRAEDWNASE